MPGTNDALTLRPRPRRYVKWTARELEFAALRRMAGFTDQAIADELGRTAQAVNWQLRYVQ